MVVMVGVAVSWRAFAFLEKMVTGSWWGDGSNMIQDIRSQRERGGRVIKGFVSRSDLISRGDSRRAVSTVLIVGLLLE